MTKAERDGIIAHARETYPGECCGLLSGRDGHVVARHPCRNVSPEPRHRFTVDMKDQWQAFQEIAKAGHDLLAIYHSHPKSPARLSGADVQAHHRHQYGTLEIVVSLEDPTCPDVRAYRVEREMGIEEEIVVVDTLDIREIAGAEEAEGGAGGGGSPSTRTGPFVGGTPRAFSSGANYMSLPGYLKYIDQQNASVPTSIAGDAAKPPDYSSDPFFHTALTGATGDYVQSILNQLVGGATPPLPTQPAMTTALNSDVMNSLGLGTPPQHIQTTWPNIQSVPFIGGYFGAAHHPGTAASGFARFAPWIAALLGLKFLMK